MTDRDLFIAALNLDDPAERQAYLEEACGDDPAARQRVEALFKVYENAGSFLESPPASPTSSMASSVPTESSGTVIGPYKLLQVIGEGGMGTVYMAEQTQPVRRTVALKLIKAGMDSRQVLARFGAERQALALMDHPNIAKVFDAGTTADGRPYFVMELVKGIPITRFCDERRLTTRERLELAIPVCQAVQHAHQKGVIHRDLKPSNILIALYDGKPVPKVIDFGVAKATGPRLTDQTLYTEFGAVVGTLEYMSPEQAELNQLDIDTRSDIYSLGVLLYELLTGSTPLDRKRLKAAAILELLRVIREEESPRPSTRLSTTEELPSIAACRNIEPRKLSGLMRGELDWIVMKALEKDRNRRYETANGLAADLRRYLDDEPVQACPPSVWYRFRKFTRRNSATLATAFILMLAALFVVGSTGWAVRDRSVRNAALDDEVRGTLNEATAQIEDAKWPEALAAVQRADKLLTAARRLERPPRLLELRKDLDMAQRLEDIYSQPRTEEFFRDQALDAAYFDAFAHFGLNMSTLPVGVAAEKIRARSIRLELVRALDFWSSRHRAAGSRRIPTWRQLLEIATLADPDLWRVQLRHALGQGDRKALEALAATADVRRLQPTTLYLLGTALHANGANEQAMGLLRRAQVQNPDDWWINNVLGWFCQTALPPQYDDALRYYTAAQAIRPRNPYNLLAIGEVLGGQKAYAEAVTVLSRAIELKPDYSDAWFKRGEAYAHLGQTDKALAEVSQGIKSNRPSAENWFYGGRAYHRMGRNDDAIAAYKEAIRLQPGFADAHIFLGLALREVGRLDEAIAAYKETIRLQPDFITAYYNLGVALRHKGLFDEAITASKEAIRLQPDHGHAYCTIGHALRQKGLIDEAIAASNEAVRLWPGNACGHRCLGLALRDKGLTNEAIASYKEAIRLQPDYAAAYGTLSDLLANAADPKLRDTAEADKLARKAVELAPRCSLSWHALGWALYRTGAWKDSIEAFHKSMGLQVDPKGGDSGQWFGLAVAHWQLGNKEEARTWHGRGVQWMDKHQPKNEELRQFRAEATELVGMKK